MASSKFSSPNSAPNWTAEKNKLFENALAIYDREAPDRWHKIAKIVGGTTEEEVKRQYEILQEDINRIESGKFPLPKYWKGQGSSKGNNITNEEQRLKNLKL
ncbi:Octamer-binding transcription factor [Trema orientale]|uniref:Octamer-binding transcription factor n=1 Tax=Trema orientale TaxID=63057 RepID=A0A2P5FXK9_TREOI|nr:Octamer-binding transcription factor [Trema orientale]